MPKEAFENGVENGKESEDEDKLHTLKLIFFLLKVRQTLNIS